jgi:hypothetical protein
MKKIIIIAVAVIIISIAGLALYKFRPANNGIQKECTLEAKICSDGSAVGRVGPNCEFSVCPKIRLSE